MALKDLVVSLPSLEPATEATETRYAVVGPHGLYDGQWRLRRDAIAEHCLAFGTMSEFSNSHQTPERRKEVWAQQKCAGDKVIKVTVSWVERASRSEQQRALQAAYDASPEGKALTAAESEASPTPEAGHE